MLGWAVLGLGAGMVASAAINEFVPQPLGSTLSLLVLWLAFALPVVFAFARSRPRALLRFRPLDLLYGIALGILLRLTQGWIDALAGGTGAWPTYSSSGGALPPGRSEEHTSELQSLMRISYAVFSLKKKKKNT